MAALLRPLRLIGQSTPPAPSSFRISRKFRADAVILLLGFPLYRLAAVGGAESWLEEDRDRCTLFFAGGSDPKRAHGVNRLGWLREVIVKSAATPSEAGYFGVLTSSPEESLEGARKSYAAPTSNRSLFSAVNGRNTAGHSRSAVTHFECPNGVLWSDRSLIDRAQSTFHADVNWRESSWPNSPNQAPPTFLFQLAALLKQRARHAVGRYVYSEQEYQLELDTQTPGRDGLLPVRGKIRNLRTGNETLFRLWMDKASDSLVPVRIEFQPRSFLRLTFEALPA